MAGFHGLVPTPCLHSFSHTSCSLAVGLLVSHEICSLLAVSSFPSPLIHIAVKTGFLVVLSGIPNGTRAAGVLSPCQVDSRQAYGLLVSMVDHEKVKDPNQRLVHQLAQQLAAAVKEKLGLGSAPTLEQVCEGSWMW